MIRDGLIYEWGHGGTTKVDAKGENHTSAGLYPRRCGSAAVRAVADHPQSELLRVGLFLLPEPEETAHGLDPGGAQARARSALALTPALGHQLERPGKVMRLGKEAYLADAADLLSRLHLGRQARRGGGHGGRSGPAAATADRSSADFWWVAAAFIAVAICTPSIGGARPIR